MRDESIEATRARRFQETALAHIDAAYNLARWLTRNDHEAEDIVQEAFLRAFRSFDGFRGGDARPWLLAIVRNTCYTWLRQHRQRDVHVPYDDEAADTGHEGASDTDPAAILARADDRRLVNAALDALPVAYREVVVLRDIEDLSYKEIAAIVAIPIGTVMSRLARGRRMLVRKLQQHMNGD